MNNQVDGRRLQARGWVRALCLASATPALLSLMVAPVSDEDSVGLGKVADSAVGGMSMGELLADAERRTHAIDLAAQDIEQFYWSDVGPLVRDLVWLGGDSTHAKRIAVALVREGLRADVDPRLLLAVMRVENPWLALSAASPAGALGLMQVMPFHAGGWGCGGDDLTDLDLNICHGTKILAGLIARFDGDLELALLRYNGCVPGISTSDCHGYPSWVLGHTESAWTSEPHRPQRAAWAPSAALVE